MQHWQTSIIDLIFDYNKDCVSVPLEHVVPIKTIYPTRSTFLRACLFDFNSVWYDTIDNMFPTIDSLLVGHDNDFLTRRNDR